MTVAEEAYCLVTVIYRILYDLLPNHLHGLFDEKCLEALIPNPNRPPPTHFQNSMTPFRGPRRNIVTPAVVNNIIAPKSPKQTCDMSTQTFSTGEISVLNVYYDN